MDQDTVIHLSQQAMELAMKVGGPLMLVGLAIGLIVSVFQAVTQIQEQTLTFVPKIIAVFMVLLITGGWIIGEIQQFTQETYTTVDHLVRS